jgi:hypothetical protein
LEGALLHGKFPPIVPDILRPKTKHILCFLVFKKISFSHHTQYVSIGYHGKKLKVKNPLSSFHSVEAIGNQHPSTSAPSAITQFMDEPQLELIFGFTLGNQFRKE